MARPPYKPTDIARQKVLMLAQRYLTIDEIALVMELSPPTVRKYFFLELQRGKAQSKAALVGSLMRQAVHPTKPVPAAAMFLLKTQHGFRENDDDVGKKELAERASRRATDGTAWDRLLPSPNAVQ